MHLIDPWRHRLAQWFRAHERADVSPVATPTVPLGSIFRRFWPALRPYRYWLWLLFLLAIVMPAVDSAIIWLFKLLVDDVLVPRTFGPFLWIALGYVGLSLGGGLVSFSDDYLAAWVGEHFSLGLRTAIFRRLHGRSLEFFATRQLGDVLSRLTGDVGAIEGLLLSSVVSALANAFRLLFFTAALFVLQWSLALVALVAAPLFWLISRRFAASIKQAARRQRRASGVLAAVAEDSLSKSMLVQAYNRQEYEVERFQRVGVTNLEAQLAATRLKALFTPLVDLVELAGVLLVIGAGTWQLAQGWLSLGSLLVFLAYLSQLYSPIRRLSRLMTSVHSAAASAERIIEIIDEQPAVNEISQGALPRNPLGTLAFDRVSFRYPSHAGYALAEVTFQLVPGETLAIVGPSGAGKSTIAKLLLRFYDPTAGRVLVDGQDLRALDLRAWRESVAVLLQETLIFDGTVRENIRYGRPDATEDAVVRAAQAADAQNFILGLAQGYDTIVGQNGQRLSGGPRQKLAIARAMVRDAPILILDEPTTGLDGESARHILAPLHRLMVGRTTILITHNLMLARKTSRLLVVDNGRVVECGSHAEVIKHGGIYARLYGEQMDPADRGDHSERGDLARPGAV